MALDLKIYINYNKIGKKIIVVFFHLHPAPTVTCRILTYGCRLLEILPDVITGKLQCIKYI